MDSALFINGPESALYEEKADVPHAMVALVWYNSPTLKMNHRMFLYAPAGYETGSARYPMLHLLHGGGGDEDAWNTGPRQPDPGQPHRAGKGETHAGGDA